MKNLMLAIFVLFAFGQPAQAASFDCAKAHLKVEHLICDNSEISKLDEELAKSYRAALQDQSRAEEVKQTQKQWMKERNACPDAACVRSAYVKRNEQLRTTNDSAAQSTEPAPIETSDKPGYFRLDKSNDDGVCYSLGRIINADIKKYGETRFNKHDEFVKWRAIDEARIVRGEGVSRYSGTVEQSEVDINNDGDIDQVVRSQWAMGGVENAAVTIFPWNDTKQIDIAELLKSNKKIMFVVDNYWRDRYRKKYDDPYILMGDWLFDRVAAINLYRQNGDTYVVAQSYAAPRNVSAKIFVFQLDKDYRKYEEKDICMFVKICPCEGCRDLRGDEIPKTLPAKKWCNK